MVATTFAADTPTLIADLVRQDGVAANWLWWGFIFSGMLTTFMFARRWRRSGLLTDVEFYELRYGGKGASFFAGFGRSIWVLFSMLSSSPGSPLPRSKSSLSCSVSILGRPSSSGLE
ncbi:hypothetical protein N9173_01175 [bacterium]|nr:hypothetical protein [bacterium]MDB4532556.1 hypothetical protein [bacterium]